MATTPTTTTSSPRCRSSRTGVCDRASPGGARRWRRRRGGRADVRERRDVVRKHPESIQKPSSDDLAAFCDAAEALSGLGVVVDAGYFRSAVAAACTGGPTALGWRAAGRLEHCVFSVLGLGPVAATVTARGGSHRGGRGADGAPSADDVAAAERLLRRGAAAAEAANDTRLAMETAAADALLAVPGPDGPVASGGGGGGGRMLCVDDTHRLLSRTLRERGGWSVTNWNRFSRKDRRGAPRPPAGGVRRRDGSSSPNEGCVRHGLSRGRGEASRRGRRVDLRRGSRGRPRVRVRFAGRIVRGRSGRSRRRSRRRRGRGRRRRGARTSRTPPVRSRCCDACGRISRSGFRGWEPGGRRGHSWRRNRRLPTGTRTFSKVSKSR